MQMLRRPADDLCLLTSSEKKCFEPSMPDRTAQVASLATRHTRPHAHPQAASSRRNHQDHGRPAAASPQQHTRRPSQLELARAQPRAHPSSQRIRRDLIRSAARRARRFPVPPLGTAGFSVHHPGFYHPIDPSQPAVQQDYPPAGSYLPRLDSTHPHPASLRLRAPPNPRSRTGGHSSHVQAVGRRRRVGA